MPASPKNLLRRLTGRRYQTLNLIELSRARMLHNLATVQARHPQFQIIPVLKGNAYGHGIQPAAQILRRSPVRMVAVDGYFEANLVRRTTKLLVLVMGHVLPANLRLLDTKRCSFVVQDVAGLHAFGSTGRPVRIHLELNTGMNRLGLNPAEVKPYLEVLAAYPKLELEGVMTHLADADNDRDNGFTERQAAAFDAAVAQIMAAGFRPRLVHIAQTAGSPKVRSRYANAMRLGIGLYGINPLTPADPSHAQLGGLQPVLELRSTIVKVLALSTGDRVSYNGTFTARKPMRAGVLPLGYYEGLPRALSNSGTLTAGRHRLPILGRVCMDHTIVDLTGTALGVGDTVTVFSHDPSDPNSIASLQEKHGLFAYSTLTGLAPSVRRVVV